MGKIVAISNQKGGVGKTTTAINLGACLARAGHQVLAVDADPQGNLTSGVGQKQYEGPTIYDAVMGVAAASDQGWTLPVLETPIERLKLVPADRDLAGAEVELVNQSDREGRLRRLLEPLRDQFAFLLVDTPPSLGLLTLNALVAADTVLIPLHCEYFALEGLADLLATLKRVRSALNPRLDIEGVLLTMYGDRTNLGQQVAREIRGFFDDKVFETVIPRNIRLAEAPSHGMPVVLYDARSRGAEAYTNLAQELLSRNGSVS
ncbi:MAG: AAA family ATPase [Luteitalea sp.]|nr:AAA family ATPase [Luteitalea sp.]